MVFAGHNLRGIFNGVYDRAIPGGIRWSRAPEFSPGSIPEGEFPGLKAYPRVTSFAECNGRLYAAVGQQIYERVDGANPSWRLVYTNSDPGYSESGLRGLTARRRPGGRRRSSAGGGGRNARLGSCESIRAPASEATELDLRSFLSQGVGHERRLHDRRLQRHGENPQSARESDVL